MVSFGLAKIWLSWGRFENPCCWRRAEDHSVVHAYSCVHTHSCAHSAVYSWELPSHSLFPSPPPPFFFMKAFHSAMKSVIWWQSDMATPTYRSALRALYASCFEWRSWEVRLALQDWPGSWAVQLSPGPSDAAPAGSCKVKIKSGFLNRPRIINLKQGTDIEEIKLFTFPPVAFYRHPGCTYWSDLAPCRFEPAFCRRRQANYRWRLLILQEE